MSIYRQEAKKIKEYLDKAHAELLAAKRKEITQFKETLKDRAAQQRLAEFQREQYNNREAEGLALKSSRDLINSGQNGYDHWVASMSQISIHCQKVASALAGSNPLKTFFYAFVYEKIIIPIGYALYDKFEAYFGSPEQVIAHLPEVVIPIEMSEDNKLDLSDANLSRFVVCSDGTDPTKSHLEAIRIGILAWLRTRGYTIEDSRVFTVQDNNQLNKDAFAQLRDDESNGLLTFISGKFKMNDTEIESLPPGPQP
ncbi:MAG: hypothetical protein ACOVQX_03520 [Legionella sp.]